MKDKAKKIIKTEIENPYKITLYIIFFVIDRPQIPESESEIYLEKIKMYLSIHLLFIIAIYYLFCLNILKREKAVKKSTLKKVMILFHYLQRK